MELATAACTRFGWTWDYVFDGVSLGVLVLMLRTGQRQDGNGAGEWTMDEMELVDWMAERGYGAGDPRIADYF